MSRTLTPIPTAVDPEETSIWIQDDGDPLQVVESGGGISLSPAYHNRGFATASEAIQLRSGALAALRRAARSLPDGMTILVWDGLRTLDTQHAIAQGLSAQTAREIGSDALDLHARYVSPVPSSELAFQTAPPPHTTGGALDVTLADNQGHALDLGADFDQFDETAWLGHYEALAARDQTEMDVRRQELRRVLYWAMVDAGFAPYPWEFWHFEYQTRRAAAFFGLSFARYGPMVPFRIFDEVDK